MFVKDFREDLQAQIERLGVSPSVLGDKLGVTVVDSPESCNEFELVNNEFGTVDLDVFGTLASLDLLPDNAGIEEFWKHVIDADTVLA